jgi:hypothetical protein
MRGACATVSANDHLSLESRCRPIVAPRDPGWPRLVTDRTKTTLCLLSQAYRRFDHPRALPQGDDRAWPALAGGPIGRHRYLEILDAGQVLDDALAINGPHVDAVQEVNSRAHCWRRCLLRNRATPPRQKGISLGEVQNSRGCRGTTESPTNRTFSGCATQLRFRLTLRPRA